MRLTGTFETEQAARKFSAVLCVRGIESVVELGDAGKAEVWVLEEDQQAEAAEILTRYQKWPGAEEYADAEQVAAAELRQRERESRGRRSEVVDMERLDYERSRRGSGGITVVLIVASVLLALFSKLGDDRHALAPYMISNYYRDAAGVSYHLPTLREKGGEVSEGAVRTGLSLLPEVFRGEVWRLVTPIFIHFGFLHLLFNLTMLRNLGGVIEGRFGALYFGALVLALAVGSNLAQVVWSSPNFGGMSGVDYGLFGFLWIRGKRDRYATWQVPASTVQVMLIWFFACAVGLIPGVANAAHAGGLVLGMIWGWVSARR